MTLPLFFTLPYWAGPLLCRDGRIVLEHTVYEYRGEWESDRHAYDPVCVNGTTRTPLGASSSFLVLLVAFCVGAAAFVVLYTLEWRGLLPRL
jgi:hypothetical protein